MDQNRDGVVDKQDLREIFGTLGKFVRKIGLGPFFRLGSVCP